jgi:hypothetical protein
MKENEELKTKIEEYIDWAGYTHTYESIMKDYQAKQDGYYICHSSKDVIKNCIENE